MAKTEQVDHQTKGSYIPFNSYALAEMNYRFSAKIWVLAATDRVGETQDNDVKVLAID
jgi:hypothetical protein